MWGLTLDTVQSVNLVLADGTITTASATENTELFWVSYLMCLAWTGPHAIL